MIFKIDGAVAVTNPGHLDQRAERRQTLHEFSEFGSAFFRIGHGGDRRFAA